MWTGIELLLTLQDIRADYPILEYVSTFFSSRIFYLIIPMIICMAFYWLFDKRKGDALTLGFVSAAAFAMGLKYIISQPRPWVLDPEIEQISAHSNGYSCPSGHTTEVTSVLIPVACIVRRRWLSVLLIIVVILTIMSRLILCVHTPLDIIVGVAVGLAAAFLASKAVDVGERDERSYMLVNLMYAIIFTAIILVVILLMDADVDDVLQYSGFVYGTLVGRVLEHRFVGYKVGSGTQKQKLIVYFSGLVVAAILLLASMYIIPFLGTFIGGFLMMVWCIFVYPKLINDKQWLSS
jgi:undecaprenyl-diphosphatase